MQGEVGGATFFVCMLVHAEIMTFIFAHRVTDEVVDQSSIFSTKGVKLICLKYLALVWPERFGLGIKTDPADLYSPKDLIDHKQSFSIHHHVNNIHV